MWRGRIDLCDPATKGGSAPDGRKVKGAIHWVSARHGIPARVCLYDRLCTAEHPDADKERDFKDFLNPDSKKALDNCILEPSLASTALADRFQFERQGYNRIADSWAKVSGERAACIRDRCNNKIQYISQSLLGCCQIRQRKVICLSR
jgi:hypothetical protein